MEIAATEDAPVTFERDNPITSEGTIDKEAFSELYRAHYRRIFSFVIKRVGNVPDSEDITSRTFEKALRCIGRYDPEKGSFSSWLYKIAINVTNDWFKKNSVHHRVTLEGLDEVLIFDSMDHTAAVRDFTDMIGLIQELDDRHQVVLVLRFMEDLGYEELSETLGCSKKAVSMRITRAVRAFESVAREQGFLCRDGSR